MEAVLATGLQGQSYTYIKYRFVVLCLCSASQTLLHFRFLSKWKKNTHFYFLLFSFSLSHNTFLYYSSWASLKGQQIKNLPEMQENFSILAWKIPWMEEPGRWQSMGLKRVWHNWVTEHGTHYSSYCTQACLFQHLSCQRSWTLFPWFCWSSSFNTAPQSSSLKHCSVSPIFFTVKIL